MPPTDLFADRRYRMRQRSEDVLRWKRPGRIEDHKAWSVDRSDLGIGFCTLADSQLRVGEVINLRVRDRDQWRTLEKTVRVARTDCMPGGELIFVGCAVEAERASADRP